MENITLKRAPNKIRKFIEDVKEQHEFYVYEVIDPIQPFSNEYQLKKNKFLGKVDSDLSIM